MKKSSLLLVKFFLFSFFLLSVSPAILSSDALAQTASGASSTTAASNVNQNVLTDTICNVMSIVTGNAGKAFAAFAIISVGIGFFTGKVSWSLMIGVSAGIAAMFGAPSIVAAITGRQAFGCSGG
jgi:type IV secretory pathway VirB2 component (pilin)